MRGILIAVVLRRIGGLQNRLSRKFVSVFFEALVAYPVIPATVLLTCLILWGLMTIVVGLDIDLDSHAGGLFNSLEHLVWDGLSSFAVVPMRWLNMRDVPIIVWLSVFSLAWWTISIAAWMSFDRFYWPQPSWWLLSLLVVRNLALTLRSPRSERNQCEVSSTPLRYNPNRWSAWKRKSPRMKQPLSRTSQIQNRCLAAPAQCSNRWASSEQRDASLDHSLRRKSTHLLRFCNHYFSVSHRVTSSCNRCLFWQLFRNG